ncbi:MAG: hypothetical protein KDA52_08935, partial [Planctomycetaceae bacterium]|nr:hypothetical protein [Planctomycetaceae bacterium]
LANCPTIAYSGEIDVQKQAADVMVQAFEEMGLEHPRDLMTRAPRNPANQRGRELVHIIGPQTAHRIHPDSKSRMESMLQHLARTKTPETPQAVSFVTSTLRYDRMNWIRIIALDEQWSKGYVYARLVPPNTIYVLPNGVSDFELNFGPGELPEWFLETPNITWEPVRRLSGTGGTVPVRDDLFDEPPIRSDRSWSVRLYADWREIQTEEGPLKIAEWKTGTPPWENELRKRHGLSGPIDDAFMDSFLFVTPSGKCRHAAVEEWTRSEFEHAVTHWRQQMRGDARVKADADITEEDIANHNLILWGDPSGNSVMERVMLDLPIRWTDSEVIVGERRFDAAHHAPILIFPNPLNRRKYVVLNSSFTYREYDYLNNARQTPKLPDWAIVDLRLPSDSRWPGKIVDADFFDEKWELQAPHFERVSAKQ